MVYREKSAGLGGGRRVGGGGEGASKNGPVTQSPGRTFAARLSGQWQCDLHAQRLPSRVAPHAVTARMAFSYR